MKKIIAILLACVLLFSLAGCGGNNKSSNPVVTITMEDGGEIIIELYPDKAPNTVKNFIKLINEGFYDGLTFHHVQASALIQGGDPEGDGKGGPGYEIKGEFSENDYTANDLSFTRGVLGMARAGGQDEETGYHYGMDTAGSQFFITLRAVSSWNGVYCAFGKVTKGLEVAERIASAEVRGGSGEFAERPVKPQVIKTITVDTFGVNYDAPATLTTVTDRKSVV